ncbi:hypothetical protein QR680_000077 [Steinernema hermaphroditum]|uniref:ascorbate ferrireductase (transmembrane) n=1 Tax=Steinernema hermaphroditum TaxID=289476 RepID=A0AA39LDN3_9BILA|nr:hypothetical protein QR680_000077 [Steinernema hermaphroditum]
MLWMFVHVIVPVSSLISDGCGVTRGCWFQPANCELGITNSFSRNDSNELPDRCGVYHSWHLSAYGLLFQMMARVDAVTYPMNGRYIALAFSLDKRMGHDTVIQCITTPSGDRGVIYASSQILSQTEVNYINGILTCSGMFNFVYLGNSSSTEPAIFQLNEEDSSYYLLSARGGADPRSLNLMVHSVVDGNYFPFITTERMSFCPQYSNANFWIHNMEQSAVPRRTRHIFAIVHGVLMLSGWWVFGASGMLIARYGKRGENPMWFHLHRLLMLLSFLCQTIAFVLIYVQAQRIYSVCTDSCSSQDFTKVLHSILGTVIYALTVVQVIAGMLRPRKDASNRPFFNVLHRSNGFICWIGAAICCTTAINLGKTGLYAIFNRVPYYVMMAVIISFVMSIVLLELTYNRNTKDCSPDSLDRSSLYPIFFVIPINAVIAVGVTAGCAYMMVTTFKIYGFR